MRIFSSGGYLVIRRQTGRDVPAACELQKERFVSEFFEHGFMRVLFRLDARLSLELMQASYAHAFGRGMILFIDRLVKIDIATPKLLDAMV